MQDNPTVLERLLQMLFLPACLYGAGGALLHSARKGRTLPQTAFEVLGGIITANMICPLVQDMTPESWHYTLFFLIGWGGLEVVSRLYEAVVSALENRIRRHINPNREE